MLLSTAAAAAVVPTYGQRASYRIIGTKTAINVLFPWRSTAVTKNGKTGILTLCRSENPEDFITKIGFFD